MSKGETKRIPEVRTDFETKLRPYIVAELRKELPDEKTLDGKTGVLPNPGEVQPVRKPPADYRIAALLGIMLLLIAAIVFLLVRNAVRANRAEEAAVYVPEGSVPIVLDECRTAAYIASGDGLAACTDAGFQLFDEKGTAIGSLPHVYSAPLLQSSGRTTLACDIGGVYLAVLNRRGKTLLELEASGTLLDADLSSGGAVCYAALEPDYKTVVTVLDNKQNEIYRWYSASRYMNQCAVSPKGDCFCAVALGESGGIFCSTAVLFETALDTPVSELPLGDQLIWELRYLSNDVICAIGEKSAVFFHASGDILGTYTYEQPWLTDYSTGGDGFTALLLNKYQAGSETTLVTLNSSGEVLATLPLGEEVLSFAAAGDWVGVLTPHGLKVYDQNLKLRASGAQPAAAMVLYPDGSALLVNGGKGVRYVPVAVVSG